jgi:cytochrome P450
VFCHFNSSRSLVRIYESNLPEIIEYVLKINAGSFSFEAANPRHEHEYHLFERMKIPEGKVLCPGAVTHAGNIVEHAPDLIPSTVEQLLLYEPPAQFLPKQTTLDEIPLAGTTIPKGVFLTLALAAGNREPARFADPDRCDPERRDNQHLGFGSGIHLCFGAPLARMEVQIALTELMRRLEQPRLVVDPPPYRPSPVLRGPARLLIEVEGVRQSQEPLALHA